MAAATIESIPVPSADEACRMAVQSIRNLSERETSAGPVCLMHEMAVIGSCCIFPGTQEIQALSAIISEQDFSRAEYGILFSVLQTLSHKDKKPFDTADESAFQLYMEKTGHGSTDKAGKLWMLHILECLNQCLYPWNATWHAERLRDLSLKRQALAVARDIARASKTITSAPTDISTLMQKKAEEIVKRSGSGSARSASEIAPEIYQALIEDAEQNKRGITTGIEAVDRELYGWRPGQMIVLAGRPSTGKTAFAIQCICHALASGVGCIMFSLEMKREQIVGRMFAISQRVNLKRVIQGQLNFNEMSEYKDYLERFSKLPFYLFDDTDIDPNSMEATCNQIMARDPRVRLIVIDYLQLMEFPERRRGASRQEEVSSISRRVKKMAVKLEVPVIALSQLNRSQEKAKSARKPLLSDLRESGALEQDSDMVIFTHRTIVPGPANNYVGEIELVVAKHRNGPLVEVPLSFLADFTKFANSRRKAKGYVEEDEEFLKPPSASEDQPGKEDSRDGAPAGIF